MILRLGAHNVQHGFSYGIAAFLCAMGTIVPVAAQTVPLPATPPIQALPTAAQTPPSDTANGDYGAYLTWPEMKEKIAAWARQYPKLVHVGLLGKTLEGRDIPLLRLSDSPTVSDKPEVLLLAGIHPREQQPQVAIAHLIDELLAGYGKDAKITKLLTERQIWIVPVFNVDGKVYDMRNGNGKRGADWRKNRRPNADGSFGVDLNRNFGVRWGGSRMIDPTWRDTTTNPKGNIYEGPAPLSEPETQALSRFIASRRTNLRAFLDIHSPLHEILFPAYSIASELARFQRIAGGMRDRQQKPYPTTNAAPDTEPPANPRGGNSGLTYTWAYYTQGVYGFNLEIASPSAGTGIGARYAPPEEIETEYRDNVREPLLFFLDAAGDLPPALPGTATCAAGAGTFDGKLRPGQTVTWTPPAVSGECDYAVLVSEKRDVVVPSEYRRFPFTSPFVLQVDETAKPGQTVPVKLYLWDKNRHVSVVPFTMTVE